MSEFQEWCKEILPIVQAGANGEVVEYAEHLLANWTEKRRCFLDCNDVYRIKPKTIKIGDIEVPEPLRVVPAIGYIAYAVDIESSKLCRCISWEDRPWQHLLFSHGLIHSSEENALKHAEAILAPTKRLLK